MRIVVTGGDGFIGKNLRVRLRELGHGDVVSIARGAGDGELRSALTDADFVFHLAGVNRPANVAEFREVNAVFTEQVCDILAKTGRRVPVAYSSSTQAVLANPYGESKREGELAVERYGRVTQSPVFILRLTNVFGKWARSNYNSAVATFCHNIARGLPIMVSDPDTALSLVYIDDVVAAMIRLLDQPEGSGRIEVGPVYDTTLGEVVGLLRSFARSRDSLLLPPVGAGLPRGLYASYLSYLRPSEFAYDLERHVDARGDFVEVLKPSGCGQFSYFTAPPGVIRGEHYHHTKSEKFLVVQGRARFGFRHVVTDESLSIVVEGGVPRVVETVPGWVHNIANIGITEMIVMVWANEVFNPDQPDTISAKVET